MSFKVRLSDPKILMRKIKRVAKKHRLDRSAITEIAQEAAKDIRERTRNGFGVKKRDGKKKELKGLSSKYKKFRTNFKDLSNFTKPDMSNLTLTGQMLGAIFGKYGGQNTIELDIKKARKKINSKAKKINNKELAEIHKKKRPFFELTDKEILKVQNSFRDHIKKKLRQEIRK